MGELRDLLRDLQAWRAAPEQLAAVHEELAQLQRTAAVCEVHRDNWPAVRLFTRVDSQWRWVAGAGGAVALGLDYAGVRAAMELAGVPRHRRARLFADLQVMERAAVPVFNARAGAGKAEAHGA